MKGFKQFITERSGVTLYHGHNHKTAKVNPKWMDKGVNQEGVGIYFAEERKVADSYGKFVSTITINLSDFTKSRDFISKDYTIKQIAKFLFYINDIDKEFWYLFTDYGVEVNNQDEITINDCMHVADMMKFTQSRNFQLEIINAMSLSSKETSFVKIWLKYMKSHGLYEAKSKYYAILFPYKLELIKT